MGDNGLINKANDAKIKTEIARIKEEIQTEILAKQVENQGDISDDILKGILEKHGTLSKEDKIIDKTLTTTKGNHEIKVSDIFNGTTVKEDSLQPYVLAETMGGANSPDINGFNVANTHYVTWGTTAPYQMRELNETNTIDKAPPTGWSNYNEKQWANILTNGGGNDCYWVWIPRYAYCITEGYHTNTAKTIDIKFLQGTTNTPIDGSNIEIKNETGRGNWNVHPAFWFDKNNNGVEDNGEQLTGIWVAKYEASSSIATDLTNLTTDKIETAIANDGVSATDTDLKVRVKPNVTSWRGITVNNIFKVCQNLAEEGNSLLGTNNLDPHMMKNTEWGAVAYLSRSIYGKNSEVWNNPYYNNTTNYSSITGLAGASENASQTNLTNTYKYNETGGGNASTTGNVYGVYDMAGGAREYVAGIYMGDSLDNSSTNISNRSNRSELWKDSNAKYVDKYTETTGTQPTYYGNTGKYGDAIYETSSSGVGNYGSWDASSSKFSVPGFPVLTRGCRAYDGISAGVFAFDSYQGIAFPNTSFRPVVLSSQL